VSRLRCLGGARCAAAFVVLQSVIALPSLRAQHGGPIAAPLIAPRVSEHRASDALLVTASGLVSTSLLNAARQPHSFARRDSWTIAALSVAALSLAPLDRRGDAWARRPGVRDNRTLKALSAIGDFTGGVGGMAVGPTTWLLGRARGDSSTAVIGLRTTEAVVLGGVAASVIKVLAGRTRPYASADNSPTHWAFLGGVRGDNARWSFPSGHATVASAAAATLAAEWQRQGMRGWRTVGTPLVYSLATLVAGSRVRDRKHWLSDVAAGSALGVTSALAVRRWHDGRPNNWIDRRFLPR
jgi:membrane-associated phospholipid phosphatase